MRRNNVVTTMMFSLQGGRAHPEERVRLVFRKGYYRLNRELSGRQPVEKTLEEIEEFRVKHGDEFTSVERGFFHQLRAAARFKAGDQAGAMDDLRIAERLLVYKPEAQFAIRQMLEQLTATGVGAVTIEKEE